MAYHTYARIVSWDPRFCLLKLAGVFIFSTQFGTLGLFILEPVPGEMLSLSLSTSPLWCSATNTENTVSTHAALEATLTCQLPFYRRPNKNVRGRLTHIHTIGRSCNHSADGFAVKEEKIIALQCRAGTRWHWPSLFVPNLVLGEKKNHFSSKLIMVGMLRGFLKYVDHMHSA